MNWVRVCAVEDIPDNGSRAFSLDGRDLLLARTVMGVFAVGAICSHQQQPLEGGKIKGCFLFCPLHGVRFDLRDGSPAGTLTDKKISTFPVRQVGDDVLVQLPAVS
jgi:3-phenylpropionate/trans-cinnamate dioxygenase ferredoxin subunit